MRRGLETDVMDSVMEEVDEYEGGYEAEADEDWLDAAVDEAVQRTLTRPIPPPRPAVPVRQTQPGRSMIGPATVRDAPNYTQCDFIDDRIDVAAQYALFRMLSDNQQTRIAAAQMLTAVKAGRLGGIYQEDQRIPAMRAQKLGLGWWGPLINRYKRAENQSAVCVPPVSSKPNGPFVQLPSFQDRIPIIAFRKSLASQLTRLGQELHKAWSQCGLPYLQPQQPSGRHCPRRLAPQPLSPKCSTQECLDKFSRCLERVNQIYTQEMDRCENGNEKCKAYVSGRWSQALDNCYDKVSNCLNAADSGSNCP